MEVGLRREEERTFEKSRAEVAVSAIGKTKQLHRF